MKKQLILIPVFLFILTGCGVSLSDAQESTNSFFDEIDSGASFEYHISDNNGNSQDVIRDANGNIKITYSGGEIDYIVDGNLTICIEDACEKQEDSVDTDSKIQEKFDSITDAISGDYQASVSNSDNGITVTMELTDFLSTDEVIGQGTFTFSEDNTSIDYSFDCTKDEETFTCFDYNETIDITDIEEISLP